VLEGKILELPARYNLSGTNYHSNILGFHKTVFVHYTGNQKPWKTASGIRGFLRKFDLRMPYYKIYEQELSQMQNK
jgi:lipopolysaccharide biosynthesis glycosyltransferase